MNDRIIAIANFLILAAVIIVNGMANALPINGYTTGELSDMYPNLFVPAGITFTIWGVIYLLMLVFVVFQLTEAFRRGSGSRIFHAIGYWFVVAGVANISWILAWHYIHPVLSLVVMIVLLASLTIIYIHLDYLKSDFRRAEKLFVLPCFSVYLGWITVATIANTTAVLVHVGWKGGGIDHSFWTILMIAIATIMGLYLIMKKNDWLFALVIIWALLGIFIKQNAAAELHRSIIVATIVGMVLNGIGIFVLLIGKFVRKPQ
ncbi:MAG: hypothetical protein U5K79_11290 [Cyclobacteriaceae bacterium]|nr:hypothetical protein [Cyclobacteriaceae bacterium]